jgi:hypothetical protein
MKSWVFFNYYFKLFFIIIIQYWVSYIELYNLFWFVFYEIFLVSYSGWEFCKLTVLICVIFFVYFYFFQFCSSICWLGIRLYYLFRIAFYVVILVFWHRFSRLTRVNFSYFFVIFFQFNPAKLGWLIGNWDLYYFFICFLYSYYGFMTRVVG